MRLKRLELFGFKSFADRTVIDFGQTTLTGIVGPNGCGKSNVVDAVRWVLGETRPTSMRGSGMTDVIFKGSASRPAMGTAEVTMVLDNDQGVLEERGPEIAISRRLYASGEGEYLIDGQRVRLKDVKDLLFDTGLGSRGYSVLEQGRIDAVLSANPAQRRAIFEEAAGISRYRQRRHETELRLKRCEQDVERLDDLMGELRSRVRSLKIQATKAEKYVTAKAEWTTGRTRLLSHRLLAAEGTLEVLRPAIEELEGGVEGLRQRRSECEAGIEAREAERSTVVAELGTVSSEVGQISGDLRALEERKSQLAMRIASWTASTEEETERAAALGVQLEEREGELTRITGEIDALRERTRAAEERAASLTTQSRELGKTYRQLRAEVEAQNERVLDSLHQRTASENKIVHLREAIPPMTERLGRVTQRFQQSEDQVGEVREQLAGARGSLESAVSVLEEADRSLASVRGDLGAEREQLELARSERSRLQVERAGLQSKVEALMDRDRELEDLSGGARRVLEASGEAGGPCHQDDLLGLVADQLRADTRLARAIDAVLGERAHALVARDAHVARRIVDWCETEEVGQVGVVVPPGVGAPDCPPPSDFALFARFGAGVEGRLGDLVQCDEAMRPLVHALFCDVVVVSSLDLALDLVGREPGWRFVTPRGEFVDAAGLVGGHRELSQGFVGRRSSAAEIEQSISRLAAEIDRKDGHIQSSEAAVAELQQRVADSSAARDAAVEAHGEAESLVVSSSARLADLEASLESHREDHAKAQSELARVEADLQEAGAQKERAAETFETENARLEQMEKGRRQLEAEREDLQREEGRAQVELTSATAESSSLEQRISDLDRLITETAAEIDRSKARVTTYSASADEGRSDIEKINADSSALSAQQGELDARLEHLREEERSGAQRITEIRREAEAVQGELDRSSETLASQRMDAQAAEIGQREVVGRADEELGIDEAALREAFVNEGAELMPLDELEAFEKQVAAVRAQLDRLGPVNVDAVHELEEVGARLEHLESQASDLAEARRALRETISTIDEESRRLFVETFEEVRGNFQQIFRLLFGGGKADIRLEEGVDVLEAGVEIVARPPGRELLAIGLLSGGQRTMTALALLFAVFEARPSPFCVLDEVDAALDDANIDRFLGMLDRFRKSTQFIVVTHNKGTMAASQALYGVTMQVKGVSRFVAVELDEIDEFAPESIGKARDREAQADPLPGAPGHVDESGEPVKELAVHRPDVPAEAAPADESPAEPVADEV